ncbi:hypothetical protein [Paenibacillus xerothermodurans]|uniref:Uncharacterized protein n=1 Tax=Paenibacillus xerothermodurans TaxID=1977292 RepID=A0A2W1P3Q4_PAEXE|nr:hypothetical protein [Paenibacillus xerothermodurans]PZE22342.1 hypothetical protein CBW46_000695 [Paenibacillus xerothermodurans]
MKKTTSLLLIAVLTLCISGLAVANSMAEYQPVPQTADTHPAYINDIFTQDGKTYVVADYIQWFEGEEADRVFAEREPDSGLPGSPNGYYIVNDNPKRRTTEVDQTAQVLMQIYNRTGNIAEADIQWNEELTLARFIQIFEQDELLSEYPYHITMTDGKITKVVQQYIP